MRRFVGAGVALLALAALLVGCQAAASPDASATSGSAPGSAPGSEPAASASDGVSGFTLTSSAFGEDEAIPALYSCDGEELSPPLEWSGAPDGTTAFAVIMEDPDADGFVHWVVVNLPTGASSLEEGASGSIPSPAIEGAAGSGELGYIGPCPPSGEHRYIFTLYALSEALAVGAQPSQLTADAVRGLIEGFVLAEAELTGTYSR
jgi:Raf kinase inhibitor-like YbhB/YbcL family protein